jgi:hypothetical protein
MHKNIDPSISQPNYRRAVIGTTAALASIAVLVACGTKGNEAAPADQPSPHVVTTAPTVETPPSEPAGDQAPTDKGLERKIDATEKINQAIKDTCSRLLSDMHDKKAFIKAGKTEDEFGMQVFQIAEPTYENRGFIMANFDHDIAPDALKASDCTGGILVTQFTTKEKQVEYLLGQLGEEDYDQFSSVRAVAPTGPGSAYSVSIMNNMRTKSLPLTDTQTGSQQIGWQEPSPQGLNDVRNQMGEREHAALVQVAEFTDTILS